MAERYYVGFDMGGTKMLAAVLDQKLNTVKTGKIRTPIGAGNKATLAAIADLISSTISDAGIEKEQISAVGVAVPGPIDFEKGLVIDLPNAGMEDYKLRDKLEDELGLPVIIENDVNAGIYGEYVRGAAQGKKNVIGVFPGTGVGGGIIIEGQLYRGKHGRAGEIGHMIVAAGGPLCGCGKYGCLEAVASKTAIAKDLVHLAMNGEAPTVLESAGTDIAKIKSSVIKKSIDAGENATLRSLERAAWYLGVGLGSCVDIFDPDLIVVGGGLVEKFGNIYLKPIEESMRRHAMSSNDTPIVAAELEDDAVFIGVASLASEALGAQDES
ncbi:MAG: ROK family protein [Spirochaetales bacterium]